MNNQALNVVVNLQPLGPTLSTQLGLPILNCFNAPTSYEVLADESLVPIREHVSDEFVNWNPTYSYYWTFKQSGLFYDFTLVSSKKIRPSSFIMSDDPACTGFVPCRMANSPEVDEQLVLQRLQEKFVFKIDLNMIELALELNRLRRPPTDTQTPEYVSMARGVGHNVIILAEYFWNRWGHNGNIKEIVGDEAELQTLEKMLSDVLESLPALEAFLKKFPPGISDLPSEATLQLLETEGTPEQAKLVEVASPEVIWEYKALLGLHLSIKNPNAEEELIQRLSKRLGFQVDKAMISQAHILNKQIGPPKFLDPEHIKIAQNAGNNIKRLAQALLDECPWDYMSEIKYLGRTGKRKFIF